MFLAEIANVKLKRKSGYDHPDDLRNEATQYCDERIILVAMRRRKCTRLI